jgi:low affinity Fe/Cu permease
MKKKPSKTKTAKTARKPVKNEDAPKRSVFTCAAEWASEKSGSTTAFIIAVSVIIVWALTGPIFGFSDTWQIVINTATTIVTFLLVFLIQNSQNRDTRALQLKLDELIRCTEGAHTVLLDLEKLDDKELKAIHCRYQELAAEARKRMRRGESDTGIADIIVTKDD